MSAEISKDPNYRVEFEIPYDQYDKYFFIIDKQGQWCEIPCATDSQSLKSLINDYFKPRLEQELLRLSEFQGIGSHYYSRGYDHKIGVGLFHYSPPSDEHDTEWEIALTEHMRAAGLDPHPVPMQLRPSIRPDRDQFLDYNRSEHDYTDIPNLQEGAYVLAPVYCVYQPGLVTGYTLAIGYKAAIGIDGPAIIELLDRSEIHEDPPFLLPKGPDRVYIVDITKHIKSLL
jgi:hypothetical protein